METKVFLTSSLMTAHAYVFETEAPTYIQITFMAYDIYSIYANVQFQTSLKTIFVYILYSNIILFSLFFVKLTISYSIQNYNLRDQAYFSNFNLFSNFLIIYSQFQNVFFQTFLSSFLLNFFSDFGSYLLGLLFSFSL